MHRSKEMLMFPDNRLFSFVSMAYPGDTFDVVSFTVDEGLNHFFSMELLLCSKERSIDFDEIIETPASCILHTPDEEIPVQGFISRFEQLHASHGLTFYRAVLSPRLWWMTIGLHCQVFLDKTVPQILEQTLHHGGMGTPWFQFKLKEEYPVREMVCQYNESHYDFFLRLMQREGMYYYFERQDNHSTLVITDTFIAHEDLKRHKTVRYVPPSGLHHEPDNEYISGLICRRQPAPGNVRLNDRHYQTPDLDLTGFERAQETGLSDIYEYGGNFLSPDEAKHLAKIRSQALLANAVRFHGESTLHSIRSGFIFSLTNHYRPDFNQDYMVVSCRHTGNQAKYLNAGVRQELQGLIEEGPLYENSFSAIPADIQYRPLHTVKKPRIYGAFSATVDAEGSGQYAELDDQGRYKIILPFDISGRKDGKASCWVRMMQPYGGPGHGLHFPLHKGAEVLLSFEGGDPDQPIIAGAVPNPAMPSQVTAADQTMCKLTTAGQNKLHIEDKDGSQRMLMSTPSENTWLRLGAPNDPPATAVIADDDSGWTSNPDTGGYRINTSGNWYGAIGQSFSLQVGGNATSVTVGTSESFVGGGALGVTIGGRSYMLAGIGFDVNLAEYITIGAGHTTTIDLAKHSKFRPRCLKTAEEKVDILGMQTKMAEMKSTVAENESKLLDSSSKLAAMDESLSETKSIVTEMKSELSETKESIAQSETKLRQDINRVLSEQLDMTDSFIAMIASRVNMGEDDFSMYTESTELTEKTFL